MTKTLKIVDYIYVGTCAIFLLILIILSVGVILRDFWEIFLIYSEDYVTISGIEVIILTHAFILAFVTYLLISVFGSIRLFTPVAALLVITWGYISNDHVRGNDALETTYRGGKVIAHAFYEFLIFMEFVAPIIIISFGTIYLILWIFVED